MLFPRDQVVAALHQRGVCYLAPSPQGDEPPLTDDELIMALAMSQDGRLTFALAGLLLVHPELAARVADLVETRTGPAGAEGPEWAWDELRKQYLAAMYLQRLWRTRLRLVFGELPLIPERFVERLSLPKPDIMFGEMGLRALTDLSPFNDWSSYQQVVDMICEQPCAAEPVPSISLTPIDSMGQAGAWQPNQGAGQGAFQGHPGRASASGRT